MNLVKCNEGHFYNKDIYEKCPHCDGTTIEIEESNEEELLGNAERVKSTGNLLKRVQSFQREQTIFPQYSNNNCIPIDLNKEQLVTKISKVNLFENYAKITRTGKFIPTQEYSEVYVYGLPNGLSTNGIHVETEIGMNCTSIDFFDHECNIKYEDENEYNTLLKEINDKIDEYKILQKKKEILFGFMKERGIKATDCEDYEARMKECQKSIDSIKKEEDKILICLNRNHEKIEEIKKKMIMQSSKQEKTKRGLCLFLNGEVGKEYTIHIHYEVYGARWYPKYDIYGSSKNNMLDIVLNGEIIQNTGEDWEDVLLTLSVLPHKGDDFAFTSLIEVGDVKKEDIPLPYMASATSTRAEYDGYRTQYLLDDNDDDWNNYNSMSEHTTSVCRDFELQLPYTVWQGRPKRIALQTTSIEIKKSFFAIPRQSEKEFLGILPEALHDLQLIPCGAQMYYDGKRSDGIIDLEHLDDGKVIVLGVSDAVRVSVRDVRVEKNIFSLASKKQENKKYEFKVENRIDSKVKLEVIDQLSLSALQDGYIQNVNIDNGEFDAKTGVCTWQIELKPKETKTFMQEFCIMSK